MLPRELQANSFEKYPARAKALALANLETLQRLPPFFAPMMLREISVVDYKFPAETEELNRQLTYLRSLGPNALSTTLQAFGLLQVTPELQAMDWVNQPARFAEQATAHLWATHQIEAFRKAALEFVAAVNAAVVEVPPAVARVGIVLIGKGAPGNATALFRKLRPHGTFYSNVQSAGGIAAIAEAIRKRAAANPVPYGHWYIDGADAVIPACVGLTTLTYESIRPVRAVLQTRMQRAWDAGTGSEALRTLLAQLQPGEFGLHGDPVFDRFQLSLLTEASGTQIYSTTFVQWAAREALRRAQPATLLVRFAPRQKERAMNELLAEGRAAPPLDLEGSVRDADMGAYYTWLNQQRLAGSDTASFLAWFEEGAQAVVIAPAVLRGAASQERTGVTDLLQHIGLAAS